MFEKDFCPEFIAIEERDEIPLGVLLPIGVVLFILPPLMLPLIVPLLLIPPEDVVDVIVGLVAKFLFIPNNNNLCVFVWELYALYLCLVLFYDTILLVC